MRKLSRREFLTVTGSMCALDLINPMSANAIFTDSSKPYCLGTVDDTGIFSISTKTSTGDDAIITVKAEKPVQTRANGDPVIEGTYTVKFDTIATHLEYKVDTNSRYEITRAYDYMCSTVHEVLSHNLWHTTSKARLDITLKSFSVAGTITGWLDFVIRNGRIYVEHNL